MMNETSETPVKERHIWIRGLYMLLMALAFQLCGTVLCVVIIIQFVIALLNGAPNGRLVSFGRGMANYLRQIVNFQTFATEELPFPFSEWPQNESQ